MQGRKPGKTGGVFAGIRRGFFRAENDADGRRSFAAVEGSISDRLLETREHIADTCLDIPVIGSGKILPPHPNAWTDKHSQSSYQASTDFEFKGHTAFRIPFPIDLPDTLGDSPPSLGPERIDLCNGLRQIHRRSIRIAADRKLLGEHPDQERIPARDKLDSSESWADRILAKAQSRFGGSGHGCNTPTRTAYSGVL